MAKKDTTKLKDLLKRQKSSKDIEELEVLEILIDKEIDNLKLKRNYFKGGAVIKNYVNPVKIVDNRKNK